MQAVVLVLLDTVATATGLLGAAGQLATLMGQARIEALVVRMPPEATKLLSEEVLTARDMAEVRDAEHRRAAALKQQFDTWDQARPSNGCACAWTDIEAKLDEAVRDHGSRADVIVLRRPDDWQHVMAHQELRSALFGTARPVLVMPPGYSGSFGKRVAIAWQNDHYAVRAVLSALRSRVAPEHVFVLAGVKAGSPAPVLPAILQEHGVAAELRTFSIGRAGVGAALLATAHEHGADMIVMGAYAHSPWREIVLGGVTQFMLGHADLPLLLRH